MKFRFVAFGSKTDQYGRFLIQSLTRRSLREFRIKSAKHGPFHCLHCFGSKISIWLVVRLLSVQYFIAGFLSNIVYDQQLFQ